MQANFADPLQVTFDELEQSLATAFAGRERAWTGGVHDALGRLANVLQQQAQETGSLAKHIGAANPDVQAVPTVARQAEYHREQQSNLVEQVYVLREIVRRAEKAFRDGADIGAGLAQIRRQAHGLMTAVEAERRKETQFTLDALNSNPGAGE